uniref:Zinc carboxypeptidase A 1 n=1 Tax=Steinernema glaseri TaxID=37863 RepID=A0A1I7YQB2_9BILA
MRVPFLFGFICLLLGQCSSLTSARKNTIKYESYDGHQVITVKISTEEHAKALLDLKNDERFRGLDFWKPPQRLSDTVDIQIAPHHRAPMQAFLAEQGLAYEIKTKDLGDVIRHEKEVLANRTVFLPGNDPSSLTLGEFHNMTEIGNPGTNKKAAFMHGCLHPREWMGCSSMLYIINELTQNADKYKTILDALDIYIIPVANPDGYHVTWTDNRMWRKTVSGPHGVSHGEPCYGVDANRNFDFQFRVAGYSDDPCDESYPGPYAFSEVESSAIAAFLSGNKDTIKAYFDVHAYSELFMYPYGYARVYPSNIDKIVGETWVRHKWRPSVAGYSDDPCDESYPGPHAFSEVESSAIATFLSGNKDTIKAYFDVHAYSELFMYPYGYARVYPSNIDKIRSIAINATAAINSVNGGTFKQGTIMEIIYPASGSTIDYAKGVLNITYPFALELRPNNRRAWGFIVDNSEIIPGAKECWAGLEVVLKAVVDEN